ncbi:hypothetical protein ACP4OV_004078 [Aristida adscensionis]
MDTAPNALSPDVNSFGFSLAASLAVWIARAPTLARAPACLYIIFLAAPLASPHLASPRLRGYIQQQLTLTVQYACPLSIMEASPSPSFERLDAGLGESFRSSTASFSFIDMDPEELFSMRWTTEDAGLDFAAPCSPLLVAGARAFSDGDILLPGERSGIARGASPGSSTVFHSALSTPASVIGSRRPGAAGKPRAAPLLATRRLLLRYLRFLAPLCRKARALRASPPSRSRSMGAAAATTPARRSTTSAPCAAEHWCHGNADTAVRDAILYCKESFTARTEC